MDPPPPSTTPSPDGAGPGPGPGPAPSPPPPAANGGEAAAGSHHHHHRRHSGSHHGHHRSHHGHHGNGHHQHRSHHGHHRSHHHGSHHGHHGSHHAAAPPPTVLPPGAVPMPAPRGVGVAPAPHKSATTRDLHVFDEMDEDDEGTRLRLQVEIQPSGDRFWVVVNDRKKVSELRREIDRQRISLGLAGSGRDMNGTPIGCSAVRDEDGFALPDDLVVGQILKDGHVVRGTLSRPAGSGSGSGSGSGPSSHGGPGGALGRQLGEHWSLGAAQQQWNAWQTYMGTVLLQYCEERQYVPGVLARTVREAEAPLMSLILTGNVAQRSQGLRILIRCAQDRAACNALIERGMLKPLMDVVIKATSTTTGAGGGNDGGGERLGLGQQDAEPVRRVGHADEQKSKTDELQGLATKLVVDVVTHIKAGLDIDDDVVKKANVSKLTKILLYIANIATAPRVKERALEGLIVVSHIGQGKAHRGPTDLLAAYRGDGDQAQGRNATGKQLCKLLLVLAEAAEESVRTYALQQLEPMVGTKDFVALEEVGDVVPVLNRLLHREATRLQVARIIRKTCTNADMIDLHRTKVLVDAGGAEVILNLSRSKEHLICDEIVFALDAILMERPPLVKGAPPRKPLVMLTPEQCMALCYSQHAQICRLASTALVRISENDDANVLGENIPELTRMCKSADGTFSRYATAALANVAVKEINKPRLMRYGALQIFLSVLGLPFSADRATDDEREAKRVAMKAVANLAATDALTRQVVLREVQKKQSRRELRVDVTDHVCGLYITMLGLEELDDDVF